MKPNVFLLLLVVVALPQVTAYDHPIFLVSNVPGDKDWCITVDEDENGVSLQPCNFDESPKNQIWYRRDYEDFSTALEEPGTRCLGYNDDGEHTLFMTDCDLENPVQTSWWQEYWRDGITLQITDYGEGLCMTPENATPTAGDKVQMISCQDTQRFAWRFYYDTCLPLVAYGRGFRLCAGSACAKYIEEEKTVKMVDMQEGDIWLFDSRFDDALCMGTGLLRMERDPSLCLQQGHGGASIRDGTWMRVYPCECNHPFQQFYCGEPGRTRSDPSLLMSVNNEGRHVLLREAGAPDTYPLGAQSIDEIHPLILLSRRAGFPRGVHEQTPVVVEVPEEDSIICLFQQNDGNLRVLRSLDADQCEQNQGDLLFHSGLTQPLGGTDFYRTQIQRDGVLATRKTSTMAWVPWSTCNGSHRTEYSLVLNNDDTLAIMDENWRVTWSSEDSNGCLTPRRDPLVLMDTSNRVTQKVSPGNEILTFDHISSHVSLSDICVVQQRDGNLRVLRGSSCSGNRGMLLYHSGISQDPDKGASYYTFLQKDGNLVTRAELSGTRTWVWQTCSSQRGAKKDYQLALEDDNSLSIIIKATGEIIWNSMIDHSCTA